MKKSFYWSILTFMMVGLLSVGFASCNKLDAFSAYVNPSDLVGTWHFTDGGLEGKTITFDSNGTYDSAFTYLYGGYYTLSGSDLTLRSSRGNKYTTKIAIKNAGKEMLMQGTADNGKSFSYTLKK